jgi:hypothetical protein
MLVVDEERLFAAGERLPVRSVTYEELVQALKHTRIWVRHGPAESTAWFMSVLHPEEAARDIFISIQASQDD